eukprot:4807827-Pyramimonas_sp.AAC.1
MPFPSRPARMCERGALGFAALRRCRLFGGRERFVPLGPSAPISIPRLLSLLPCVADEPMAPRSQ